MMKKGLKIISDFSIIAFGLLLVSSKFIDLGYFNSSDFTNTLVIIYLISSLYYYKMELKDKDSKIQELKHSLKKNEKSSN